MIRAGGRCTKDPLKPSVGGLTYAQGPHVTYEKILILNVFKIFLKIFSLECCTRGLTVVIFGL